MKRKDIFNISLIVFISIFLIICTTNSFAQPKGKKVDSPMPPIVIKLLSEAKKSVTCIDMETLKAALDSKEDVAILDVRLPEDYTAGHIPGAINIPRGKLEFMVWKRVVGFPKNKDMSKKMYIYCKGGAQATLATKSLRELGFPNAILVDMKIAEWKKAGYPIEKQ